MDYIAYDQIMHQYLTTWIVIGMFILVISCACLFWLLKNREDKVVFIVGLILVFSVIIGTFMLVGNTILDALYDLNNHSYITIEGAFEVVDDEQTPSRACSIILRDGTRLDTTTYVMEEGNYIGYVVYAEKTKKVLRVNIS